jgi:hypothetical protein
VNDEMLLALFYAVKADFTYCLAYNEGKGLLKLGAKSSHASTRQQLRQSFCI